MVAQDELGTVKLEVLGGPGGHGGFGGPGGAGRDATRWSWGGNGGPGGMGGAGGVGSHGMPGGNGGAISIAVSEYDAYLLMAIQEMDNPVRLIAPGKGGNAGRHGPGGMGGFGGRGGRSYHWTETSSYTDSQGNTRTTTHHRSNPGGWRGPPGLPGPTPMTPLAAGQDGTPGTVIIKREG